MRLLTVAEVAAELQVSVRVVLACITSGELRAVKGLGRGRGYRIRREWVESFLRGREEVVAAADTSQQAYRAPARARFQKGAFSTLREARAALGLVRGGKP